MEKTTLEVKCKYERMLSPNMIKYHSKNANRHNEDQINILCNLLKYQGWRKPIIISKLSNKCVSGHGRLEAAKKLGVTEVPIEYQDFQNSDQEYAFLISDNTVSELSMTNISMVNEEIENLGPDFDIDLLGIKDFKLDPSELNDEINKTKSDTIKVSLCPECGYEF